MTLMETNETSFEELNISLNEFLKDGNNIKTKFITDSEWIQNTISNIEEDTFKIKVKISYVMNHIARNDVMEFKYQLDEYEYVLRGTIEEINIDSNTILVRIYNIKRIKNRRKDIRFDVNLCCYILLENAPKPFYSVVNNISRGGISVQAKADMDVGSSVMLNLYLAKDKIISLAVKILRKQAVEQNFIYDASIENIGRKSQELFDELFSVLETFDDDLFFEYINKINKT